MVLILDYVNLALHKPAWQSTTKSEPDIVAGMAVDGDPSTSSETMVDSTPWLTVDLLDQYIVQEVALTSGSNYSGTC